MLKSILRFLFGDKKEKDAKRLMAVVAEINRIAEEYKALSDEEVASKTTEFRRLLHAPTRMARIGNRLILCEIGEEILRTHPDVKEAVFVPTRRDILPGGVSVFVVPKNPARSNPSLGQELRAGISARMDGLSPKSITFLDELPMVHDELLRRERPDWNELQRAVEKEGLLEAWQSTTWQELRGRLGPAEEPYTLEDILPDAFAAVKEACRRLQGHKFMVAGQEITWNMVPYDVQLMGGIALAQRSVAEMGTGEGKTLTAIAPLYLYALAGKGAHLITVNDYLSKRDAQWNAPVFSYLGMMVDCIDLSEPHSPQRRLAYLADVTYGTNNEFGFDYLRDNMATDARQLVQRGHFFAIVDEADSIMIDEARTPLIISGPVDRDMRQYTQILPSIRNLVNRQLTLVNQLVKEAEEILEKDKKSYEAGIKLALIARAMPKHTRFMKLRQEPEVQRLQEKVELDYMREKRMHELEAELYFTVDEKHRQTDLTEKGRQFLSPDDPSKFVLIDLVDEFAKIDQMRLPEEEREKLKAEKRAAHDLRAEELHAISQLLHAFALKQKDVDYVVEDNKVVIVDEFTGRKLAGRRWSDGLHQAVEAKEGVPIEKETQTLATVTIQNYFRLYRHLAGMTGTAETEAAEFMHTYSMDVVVVPPNRPTGRVDLDDVVFRTVREKYNAVLDEVERLHKMGLPVLVGTASVQSSETLSRMLRARKLPHEVLNAKNHSREAQIVALAGTKNAITIATNMAGRGTDIKLGEGVRDSVPDETGKPWPGGLQIIGTERHEARRIDRQLRGRAGRQGDPGTSRFFLSLEDDLIRWFGGERISSLMLRMGMQEGEPIIHRFVTNAIERAQRKVEAINHERRKRLLEFDNVMNEQRKVIYGLRRDVLMLPDLRTTLLDLMAEAISAEFAEKYGGDDRHMGDADVKGWVEWIQRTIATEDMSAMVRVYDSVADAVDAAMEYIARAYDEKESELGSATITQIARMITLRTIDANWMDHLLANDDLREGIHLRGYGQKDPVLEYRRDSTELFNQTMADIQRQVFERFFRASLASAQQMEMARISRMIEAKPEAASSTQLAAAAANADGEETVPDEALVPAGDGHEEDRHRPKVRKRDMKA
jgi:preprotein translocase subunit SecA